MAEEMVISSGLKKIPFWDVKGPKGSIDTFHKMQTCAWSCDTLDQCDSYSFWIDDLCVRGLLDYNQKEFFTAIIKFRKDQIKGDYNGTQ